MQPRDIATLPTLVFGEPGDFRERIVNEILVEIIASPVVP